MKIFILTVLALSFQANASDNFDSLYMKNSFRPVFKTSNDFQTPSLENTKKTDIRWYGYDSRKAKMTFKSYIYYKLPSGYENNPQAVLTGSAQLKKIGDIIDLQLQHMYGAFTMHPGFEENPGIPSNEYEVKIIDAQITENPKYLKINYSYEDFVVFSARIFSGDSAKINFVLPKDPKTIYKSGFPKGSDLNTCTDEHYNSEGDFWYFWNPYADNCPIGADELVSVNASLKAVQSTQRTFPEYLKFSSDKQKPALITYLVGVDENFKQGDLGRETFEKSFYELNKMGLKLVKDNVYSKTFETVAFGKKTIIELKLLNPDTVKFAQEAAKGLKESDIFIYNGHSGLGGYLNPQRISSDSGENFTLDKNKYQIFYFNGCSTYAYYSASFFNMKKSASDSKGTKNLDILTTAIGADFAVGSKADIAFLNQILSSNKPSWQEIMNKISRAEGRLSALTHINGDEDNPSNP